MSGRPTRPAATVIPVAPRRPSRTPPTTALFQPLQGVLPYPTDIYFRGSTDGTLNIQPANALMPLQSSVNQLDGFSTNAVIRTRFASPIDESSLNATNVYVAQVVIDTRDQSRYGLDADRSCSARTCTAISAWASPAMPSSATRSSRYGR